MIELKIFYITDNTRLGVTVLDGDPHHTGLLKFALTKENFADTLVLLVVSMSQPWSILESLQKWTQILQDHINRLKYHPKKCTNTNKAVSINIYGRMFSHIL